MYIGIHLSGSNSQRTSVVSSQRVNNSDAASVKVERVYEHIGSMDLVHSDKRLLDIIAYEKPSADLFTDVPLQAPPCVRCRLEVCPGIERCETVAVAYMSKLKDKRPGLRRRNRLFNPQSQRLWDCYKWSHNEFSRMEPSYNPAKSPLVVRARVLQKQLKGQNTPVSLKETSVPHFLFRWAKQGLIPPDSATYYKRFSDGSSHRRLIVHSLVEKGLLLFGASGDKTKITDSVDLFCALICSYASSLFHCGHLEIPPETIFNEEGWVYLPRPLSDAAGQTG